MALERWQALEGVYVLKTNLPVRTHPVAEVLRAYKGQSRVERRFHHLKGPLAVAPMFLEKPERIAGLLCILVWALMVLALMERQVRRELKGQAMYGLYPENRPSPAPTGPALMESLSGLCIVVVHQGKIQQVGTPEQLLGAPANAFVKEFLAELDSVEGRATEVRGWLGVNDAERIIETAREAGSRGPGSNGGGTWR